MLRNRLPFALLLAAALVSGCSSDGISEEKKQQLIEGFTETASQYYAMGEFDRANAQCIKGLEIDPDNDRLKLIRAWTLIKRGTTQDVATSEKLFRELQSTGDQRAVLGLAQAVERRGLAFAESAEKLRSGQRISEATDPQQRIREYEAESRRAWDESYELYRKSLDLKNVSTEALNGLVRVEMLRGNTKEALGWDEKLIESVQVSLDFWNQQLQRSNLSTSDESQYRNIVKDFTKVVVRAHQTAADLCLSLDRDEQAVEHLDAAIKLAPDQPENYARRAQALKGVGRPGDALRDVDKFLAISTLDPNHPDIQRAWRLRKECQQLAGP